MNPYFIGVVFTLWFALRGACSFPAYVLDKSCFDERLHSNKMDLRNVVPIILNDSVSESPPGDSSVKVRTVSVKIALSLSPI